MLAVLTATTIALGLPAGTRLPGGEPERPPVSTISHPTPPSRDASIAPSPDSTQPDVVHPTSITIPFLDVRADVIPVGISDNAEMEVPADIRDVGWYLPTAPLSLTSGSTVLVGHRDGKNDPNGVFRHLDDLDPGHRVFITDSQGTTREFRVRSVTSVTDADFTRKAPQLFVSDGPPRVILLTCGGAYVRDKGGYQSTIVVIAAPQ